MDSREKRLDEIHRLVDKLPDTNKSMLTILMEHLANVVIYSDLNLMTASNLGVCFGPTLMRSEEETVAAIMDIKFGNVVVEILIQNWRNILKAKTEDECHQTQRNAKTEEMQQNPKITQPGPKRDLSAMKEPRPLVRTHRVAARRQQGKTASVSVQTFQGETN